MSRHLLTRSNESEHMTLFQTFSPSDMNWDGFHRLIPESHLYLGKKASTKSKIITKQYHILSDIMCIIFQVVKNASDIPKGQETNYITSKDDFLLRSTMVNKYSSLFVEYFCTRLELFIELVLKPILGIKEFYIRHEFQQRYFLHEILYFFYFSCTF